MIVAREINYKNIHLRYQLNKFWCLSEDSNKAKTNIIEMRDKETGNYFIVEFKPNLLAYAIHYIKSKTAKRNIGFVTEMKIPVEEYREYQKRSKNIFGRKEEIK